MYFQSPRQTEKKDKEIKALMRMWYGYGIFDLLAALMIVSVTRPSARFALVWAGNVMFITCIGAYWITKAEDLRKTLKHR